MTGAEPARATGGGVARRLRLPAELERIAEARQFVRSAAADAGAPVECLEDLAQAVDEAATNVVLHGYRGGPGWLEIAAEPDGHEFVVTLEDGAPEFDPTGSPEPDLTVPPLARRPGGMGVHLIRASTDRLTYRPRPGGGNILTMVRSLRPDRKEDE
ncbi:MAG TPA: ATP-binding protein [Candidatus Limnocylindrales bacterium]|nr:ATP-binding protein [Candidatus Limnocylindrales bacterium]